MVIVLLIKFIYKLRIQVNQNLNILMKMKIMVLMIWKVEKLFFNSHIIPRISIKILKSVTQAENVMY